MSDSDESTTKRSVKPVICSAVSLLLVLSIANYLLVACTDDSWPNVTLAIWTVGLTLATIALAAGAFLALRSLDESRRPRHLAAMTDMSQRWDSDHFRDVRKTIHDDSGAQSDSRDKLLNIMIHYRNTNHENYRKLLTEPSFLEDLAISIKHGGIHFDIVKDSLGYIIWDRWCLWQPTVEDLRDRRKERTVFVHFQELAEKMQAELSLSSLADWDGPKF